MCGNLHVKVAGTLVDFGTLVDLQLQKLEEAGYVSVDKAFVGRRPKTTCHLTRKGQIALAKYLDTLQQLLSEMGRVARETYP